MEKQISSWTITQMKHHLHLAVTSHCLVRKVYFSMLRINKQVYFSWLRADEPGSTLNCLWVWPALFMLYITALSLSLGPSQECRDVMNDDAVEIYHSDLFSLHVIYLFVCVSRQAQYNLMQCVKYYRHSWEKVWSETQYSGPGWS